MVMCERDQKQEPTATASRWSPVGADERHEHAGFAGGAAWSNGCLVACPAVAVVPG
jgi:hypothetical protein